MTRKIILIFQLLLIIACDKDDISSFQADSFIKFYNAYPVFMSADVKQLGNGGYAVLGSVETLTSGTQICLLTTDEYGNSVDSALFYGRSQDDRAYCLQVLPDGFAILGSSENPVNGNLEVYFIRTDILGDTLWTRTIGRQEDMEAYHFEIDDDGSFVMVGYAKRTSAPNDKQIWLFAIDQNGEDLWPSQRIIGGDKDEAGHHLQLLDDGRIIITGNTRSFPVTTLTDNSYILITNNIGVLVNFIEIGSATDEEGNCIRLLDDGSYLMAGTVRSAGTGSDIFLRKVPFLLVDGEIPDPIIFENSGEDAGISVIVDGNDFVVLGTTATVEGSAISLIKTDLNGNNPVFSLFGLSSQMTGTSFEKTSDNGFIITGSNKHSEGHVSVVLIKTKSDTTL